MSDDFIPRVAFCTDTFDEPNGVATISRQFAGFAQRSQYPVLMVRPGERCLSHADGSVTFVDVRRSSLYLPLDMGLRFDLRISRHFGWLKEQFTAFDPDIVHITGPGDIGMICARLAHALSPKRPLIAGWHTNLHQYGRLRALPLLRMLPRQSGMWLGDRIEHGALRAAARFYRTASLILAPNDEILSELAALTRKPGRLMPHGVDAELFVPAPARSAGTITLGYVGRLTPEKNVRFLAEVAAGLPAAIRPEVRFLIVGNGSERSWLERNLPNARFIGALRGRELADAYASMDVFLFPSQSDTFGLVVLEAMASGVPVVAFRLSGPRSAVEHGRTGYTCGTPAEFIARVLDLVRNAELRSQLGQESRCVALRFDWAAVFRSLYASYATVLPGDRFRTSPAR